ncbi:cell wall assembly and cell proliferation coordinating protein [Tothia fuscella]|uniref:Cell wall assembly and cell proliferation coordinating protein n=1 Tax=Tothia fuscella TaxID=1048955 RepID=A0A9P4U3G8_9PEZI|nr:cell wall assembly and cell proliferation coordinating protein [Tothia fuscella]
MAPNNILADTWRSFWHTMTSNDRHASHDSPYRTGQHVPLPQSRHAPLTSVATSAVESRADLHDSTTNINGFTSPSGRMSPNSPYSPGMRSNLRRQSTDPTSARGSIEKAPATEIQMQSFNDGLPPPPPVSHTWKRIDRWAEDNYEELFDNLCEGATANDVNELEHQLDCSLPVEVRESLQVHDGQEHGGRPTGILFGCMLLDCEEIMNEWKNWRVVNEEYLTSRPEQVRTPQIPTKAFAGPSSSSATIIPTATQQPVSNPLWRDELLDKQQSQPPNAVQKAYAHPCWIPLARDWGGNCIAVDLAPGPTGKFGQIIIFGRDYDTKFVIARSWASFLAAVADDLSTSDKVRIEEESGDLKFKCFKHADPPYLEILRWRCDQKYGRRPPSGGRRKTPSGLRINSNVGGPPFDSISSTSPYGSPVSITSDRERGRSPQRFGGGKAPATSSPMRPMVSSPLARVAEEAPAGLKIHTNMEPAMKSPLEKLVSVDSPRPSGDFTTSPPNGLDSILNGKENMNTTAGAGKTSLDGNKENLTNGSAKIDSGIGEMKTVEI